MTTEKNSVIIARDTNSVLLPILDSLGLRLSLTLTDSNVESHCLSRIPRLITSPVLSIPPGERHKDIHSVEKVWNTLHSLNATRNSLIINLGGGMVTDLGGFAASTFKRGIPFINIATSLLGAVDASIGGKTAINCNGIKNEIGLFSWPLTTVVGLDLLSSLPYSELLSGYGEMIKTAFISSKDMTSRILNPVILDSDNPIPLLEPLIRECLDFKRKVVDEDPTENGIRKILNFGHTAGHAFEALAIIKSEKSNNPEIPHGVAVAYGILTALVISNIKLGLDSGIIAKYATFIKDLFPHFSFSCHDYPFILKCMHNDKKNFSSENILFTLLREIGNPVINVAVNEDDIKTALDITTDYIS